jgi:hypothetical protein
VARPLCCEVERVNSREGLVLTMAAEQSPKMETRVVIVVHPAQSVPYEYLIIIRKLIA